MLEIEVVREKESQGFTNGYIVVNGRQHTARFGNGNGAVFLYDVDENSDLYKVSFAELKQYFSAVRWDYNDSYHNGLTLILKDNIFKMKKYPAIILEERVSHELFDGYIRASDFTHEVRDYILSMNNENIEYYHEHSSDKYTWGIAFYLNSCDSIVQEEFNKFKEIAHQILQGTIWKMISSFALKANKNAFVSIFEFPQEIKTSCQQYLVYFTQFLKDIGIDATSDFTTECNKLLFSVKPKNSEDGLEKIKYALEIYLNLPSVKNIDVYESNEIAVQQLKANIMHLKGQVLLYQSVLQLKDATIESLQLSNYQYKSLFDSKENNSKKDVEEVSFFNGILKAKTYENYGFSFDIAKLLKWLKRNK